MNNTYENVLKLITNGNSIQTRWTKTEKGGKHMFGEKGETSWKIYWKHIKTGKYVNNNMKHIEQYEKVKTWCKPI